MDDLRQDHRPMKCGVCMKPLEHHLTYLDGRLTGEQYEHLVKEDHEPVLVPSDEDDLDIVSVCDFCQRADPEWEFQVTDFDFPLGKDEDGSPTIYGSIGNWIACDDCKCDVVAGRWEDVCYRWFARHPDTSTLSVKARRKARDHLLNVVWAGFQEHRVGEPFPIGSR